MANQNTFMSLVGAPTPAQGSNVIPAWTPTGTSAAIITNQAGNPATMYLGQGTLAGASAYPSYAVQFDGRPFRLKVSGKASAATTCNLTIAIHVGTTTTYTSGQVVATTGALALAGLNTSFFLEATLLWDSVGGKIRGTISGASYVNATAVSAAAVTNAVAVTTQAGLTFQIAATFSDTTSGTGLTITDFSAELV